MGTVLSKTEDVEFEEIMKMQRQSTYHLKKKTTDYWWN